MNALKDVIGTTGGEQSAELTTRGAELRRQIEANIDRISEVLDNRGGALASTLGERSAALGSLIDTRVAQIGETLDSRLTGFESRLSESAEAAAIRLASSASTIEIAVEGRLSGFENRVTARIGEVTQQLRAARRRFRQHARRPAGAHQLHARYARPADQRDAGRAHARNGRRLP